VAEQQNILIKILADVAGANASFGKLQKTLGDLSNGTITLSKNFNAFEKGVRGSIGAQKAAEQVSKRYEQILRQRLSISRAEAAGIKAVTEMHKAEAAAINAKLALQKAELAGDSVLLKEMQQELQLRRLAVQEIELENRERRALTATKKNSAKATAQVTEEVQRSTGAMGSASFALLSFGQGLQDSAQFGMGAAQGLRAVNNNIQQFVTALALGSEQAGGMKNLLRDMRSLLIGPAGVIVAFSLVSAALEFFTTRAQRANRESEKLSSTFSDLAEVIPTRNVRSFLVTQMSLEKQAADLRRRISELSNETVMIGTNYGVVTQQTEEAKEETKKLQLELNDINKALEDINKSGPEYIEWLKSIDGLQALSAKTAQDFQVEIANLEAQVAMSGEFSQFEERIAALRNVIASGLGFDFKDPDVAIAEFEKRYAAFSARLSEIGVEISRSKFAKLFKDGETEEFFSEEYKDFVTNRIKETIKVAKELQEVADSFMAPEQLVSAAEQRMEEIQRSSTLVGRMQGVQGIQPEELQQISPEAQAEIDAIGQAIDEQNRQGTDSWMTHWSRRTEATLQSAQIMQQAIGSIGGTFMQLAQTGDKSNKRLFETGKKLAIAQALISTYVGFTKALEQGGPLGIVTGASVLAAGMAKVAAIRSTKMNGGGGGGGSSAGGIRGLGSLQEFNVGNLYSGTPNLGSAAGFPSLSIASMAPQGMQLQLVARGPDLVSAVDAQRSANTRLIGGSR